MCAKLQQLKLSNVDLGKGGRHCAVNNCSNGDYGLKKNGQKQFVLNTGVFKGGGGVMTVTVVHHMNYITFQHE